MPNLGAAIWRTILNIRLLCFPKCVPELLLSHLPKFIEFYLCIQMLYHKNVSWPHFSWATLYISITVYFYNVLLAFLLLLFSVLNSGLYVYLKIKLN